jgi:methylglutaconyl-CoA hydratase
VDQAQHVSVLYDVADHVATLTLNRPEKRNALDDVTIADLKAHIARAESDVEVRVVMVRGAGNDFCAGGDLSQLERIAAGGSREENLKDAMNLGELFIQMRAASKPSIAVVQGNALAGGAGLATACDLIVAEETARFGYPEVNLGFVPAMVMAMLVRAVGEKKAFELAALGTDVSAVVARDIGLVNIIADAGQLNNVATATAKALAKRSSSAISLIKGLIHDIEGKSFQAAVAHGAEVNIAARATPDCQNGVRRFLESRKKKQ